MAALATGGVGLLSGCAAPQTTALGQAPSPHGLPTAVELTNTPFFPQTAYQCGPAALATVLAAQGRSVSPDVLGERIFLPARRGTLQVDMLAGARREGLAAVRLPGRLLDLLREIAAGHPVVVLQNLGLDAAPVWHYAVVIGYRLDPREVLLRSGTTPRQRLPMSVFEHTWVRAGSWAFVVLPPGLWPATAEEPAVVEAAIGLERAVAPTLALKAYASAVQRWPDSLALTLGLGNTAFAAGNKVLAADSFQTAARRHRNTPAWINLGRTLLDADLPDSAWRVALEAEYLNDPRWRAETTALLRDAQRARQARGGAGSGAGAGAAAVTAGPFS